MVNSVLLAYIDPNSGAIILQMILAGLIGTAVFFRNWVWRLLGLFRFRSRRSGDDRSQSST